MYNVAIIEKSNNQAIGTLAIYRFWCNRYVHKFDNTVAIVTKALVIRT